MTKELILDEKIKYAWECDEGSPVIPYLDAEKAMDEYAKQQAIAFFRFCLPGPDDFEPSISNRYNQFIEQQNKP